MSAPIKQNVFVPQYPGKELFEEYHGVPAQNYLQRAKEALEKFLFDNKDHTLTVTTCGQLHPTKICHLKAVIEGDEIKLVSNDDVSFSIKPTKWGIDEFPHDRFWFFNETNFQDFNIERD